MRSSNFLILLPISVLLVIVLLLQCSSAEEQLSTDKNSINRGKCNVYEGSWVFDESYPLYDSSLCPFIRQEFDCRKYGRPDSLYLRFRWQPSHCLLPRFNGVDFLKRMKGKKIMFIGDSISLNQWQSLVCLLHSASPSSDILRQTTMNDTISYVYFQRYDVTVMLFNSPYLVDIEQRETGRILKLDSLENGEIWQNVDVLVFNTWLWWYRRGPKQPWDYIEYGGEITKDMDRMVAFERALKTWAKWVDSKVNTTSTRVFFQGISPSHYNGSDWNEPSARNCMKEEEPVARSSYPGGQPRAAAVLKAAVAEVQEKVHLLDITLMSQLRKDAHPSRFNGFKAMDCTHWCIAGLPDSWNHLLYAALISSYPPYVAPH